MPWDKGRQGETKQSDLSPAFRHAMGDKGRRSISAQHLDTLWETKGDKGDKAKSSRPSIQTRHPHTPWETKGDKRRQNKVISAQHPDTPWETTETRRDKAK